MIQEIVRTAAVFVTMTTVAGDQTVVNIPQGAMQFVAPKDYVKFNSQFVNNLLKREPGIRRQDFVYAVAKVQELFAPNITIAVTPCPFQSLPPNIAQLMTDRHKAKNPSFRVLSDGTADISGCPGYLMNGTYTSQRPGRTLGVELLLSQLIIVRNAKMIIITYTALPKDFEGAKGAFGQMLKSIRWTNRTQ